MKKLKHKLTKDQKLSIYSVYQPIVDVSTGKVFGYEALTRGTGKVKQPDALFRKSYEAGFTIALDIACLESAMKILPEFDADKRLFLNIEPVTVGYMFRNGSAKQFFKKFTRKDHNIVLELTERIKERDFQTIRKCAKSLVKMGATFAIDDADGINYQFIQLVHLKPGFVKIDMSIVRGLATSRFQQKMIKEMIAYCKKHRTQCIAEGVESLQDVKALRKMGVNLMQGFYFKKPQRRLVKSLKKLSNLKR